VGEGGDIRGKWPKPLDDQQSGKFGYLITAQGVKNTMYSCKTRDGGRLRFDHQAKICLVGVSKQSVGKRRDENIELEILF